MGSPHQSNTGRASLRMECLEDRTTPTTFQTVQIGGVTVAADRIIVTGSNATALSATPFVSSVRSIGGGMFSVRLNAGTDLNGAVAFFQGQAGLQAELDPIMNLERRPNDSMYSQQYGPRRIGAETAWNVSTGTPGFTVAVIDSGVDYTHPDIAANIWRNAGEVANNGIDDDNNGYVDDVRGWDFIDDDNDPIDEDGHGTHVAGIIGATGNNARGVTGVNWGVQIMPLRAIGGAPLSAAVGAINYAVDMGVKVSNNSWGSEGAGLTPALGRAMARAQAAGHIFVASAGNANSNNDTNSGRTPSNFIKFFDNVVPTAATDSADVIADFSNFGAATVVLSAPGVDVLSTYPFSLDTTDGTQDGFTQLSGTSMASPHVAGAVALYWGANPNLTYQQVINKLKASVDPVAGLRGLVATGGRLNVAKMFQSATVPPVVVGAAPGSGEVRVLGANGTTARTLNPHPGFLGGIEAASGDVTGDGVADVVTAATLGGHVKVFDGSNGRELRSFFAFPGYVGPISVAIGDLTGDGIGDLIVSASVNGHVKVFNGQTGAVTFSSLVYSGYRGMVSVAAADTDGDGRNELLTAANGQQGVHVKAFAPATLAQTRSFLATDAGPWQDFSLAAADLDADGIAELLVSQGPRVRVTSADGRTVRADFLAFDPQITVPVKVTAGRFFGDPAAQVAVIAQNQGQSHVKVFEDLNFTLVDSFFAGTR